MLRFRLKLRQAFQKSPSTMHVKLPSLSVLIAAIVALLCSLAEAAEDGRVVLKISFKSPDQLGIRDNMIVGVGKAGDAYLRFAQRRMLNPQLVGSIG